MSESSLSKIKVETVGAKAAAATSPISKVSNTVKVPLAEGEVAKKVFIKTF